MDSIYWVVSKDCNQRCPHCYNDSAPGADGLSLEQASIVIGNLPAKGQVKLDRIILSGGEVLVWPELLFHTLQELYDRYGDDVRLMVQTNGDLLDEPTLQRLLDHHVCRIDVASMDKYHPKSTRQRRDLLRDLFEGKNMREFDGIDRGRGDQTLLYAFWGATEDMWIGPLWPRGRAQDNHLSKAQPENRFCADWSGAKNFLEYNGVGCEVNVQLAELYPCCPMTCRPIGSLLEESLLDILDRRGQDPIFQALNRGRPEEMGVTLGISAEYGEQRTQELGNHCLWCDEFFSRHAPDRLWRPAPAELVQLSPRNADAS